MYFGQGRDDGGVGVETGGRGVETDAAFHEEGILGDGVE